MISLLMIFLLQTATLDGIDVGGAVVIPVPAPSHGAIHALSPPGDVRPDFDELTWNGAVLLPYGQSLQVCSYAPDSVGTGLVNVSASANCPEPHRTAPSWLDANGGLWGALMVIVTAIVGFGFLTRRKVPAP
jgi:hypothetical protein